MRRKTLVVTCLLAALTSFTAWSLVHTISGKKSSTVQQSTIDSNSYERDILPEINAINGDERAKPSKQFHKGRVSKTVFDNYLEKTNDGFIISFPSPTIVPTPAVIDGNIYVSGGFGSKQYYSFDQFSGDLQWAVNLDDDGPSAAAIEDGVIVFNTESCTIFACDLVSGKQIWSYWLGDPLMSMPTIANGIVFTSYPAAFSGKGNQRTNDGKTTIIPTHVVIAIELKTGKILWQKWIDSDIMSAPVAKDDLLYITSFGGVIYKFKQTTGEILEAKATRATSAPVLTRTNEVIISRRDDNKNDSALTEVVVVGYGTKQKKGYRKRADYLDQKVQDKSELKSGAADMDAGNGFGGGAPTNSNWMAAKENIGQSNVSSLQAFQGSRSVYIKGRLYSTMGDEMICVDSSGKTIWKHSIDGDMKKAGGFVGTPPIYVNGYLIVATITGDVLIMDEKEGTVKKKYNVKHPVRYQPVADQGWIYVTTTNGKLIAINTGDPNITGWNMWGANAKRSNSVED